MTAVCFVDTETTGLDPDHHQIWEVGLIVPGEHSQKDQEHHWFLPVDLSKADVIALNIGRFHERHPWGHSNNSDHDTTDLEMFAAEFARLTWGKHLAGAVVSFDAERLARLLRAHGQCPGWHYHLIDVEALAVGYLRGVAVGRSIEAGYGTEIADEDEERIAPPWKSDQLTTALGLSRVRQAEHTALGDARWAKAIYDTVMGSKP